MDAAPEVTPSRLSFTRARPEKQRRLRVPIAVTHVVQELRGRAWETVQQATEADCFRTLELVQRHFPDKQYRVATTSETIADGRRKTWSVTDADHVPIGSRVLLARAPKDIHPSLAKAWAVFQIPGNDEEARFGTVKSRHRRFGSYQIVIEGSEKLENGVWRTIIAAERADLIYPIPDNVVPLDLRRGRR